MIDLLPIKQKSNININNLFSLDTCKLGVMWVIYDINKKMIIDYGSSKPNVYPKNRIKPSTHAEELVIKILKHKSRINRFRIYIWKWDQYGKIKKQYCCKNCTKLLSYYKLDNKIFTFKNNEVIPAIINNPTLSLGDQIIFKNNK